MLEPEIVNQIEGVCMYLSEIKLEDSSFNRISFPKYQTSKKKIKYVIEKLNTYTIESHSFTKFNKDEIHAYEKNSKS